ncbi:sushi domain-containing protein [Trichonephila clavipes]|nr:sushi domain-containing protein [Trichonephila clavipes]
MFFGYGFIPGSIHFIGDSYTELKKRAAFTHMSWRHLFPARAIKSAFVDCTLRLKTAGLLKCNTNTVEQGPECSIECDKYADKPNVPQMTNACNEYGEWSEKLPHCVEKEGIKTVKPPKKRVHTEALDYP